MHISELSVKRPVATFMFFVAFCLLGAFGFSHLSVELLPDIAIPRLVIETRFSGAAPEEVETQITQQIESQFATLKAVRNIQSVSKSDISLVTLEFYWGTQMDQVLLEVREKLDDLSYALPESAGRPNLLRFDPAADPIMTLVVTSGRLENPKNQRDATEALMELKNFVTFIAKRRLEQINGIAQAVILGGLEREIRVIVDINRLNSMGITLNQVTQALDRNNWTQQSAGTIRKGLFRYSFRAIGQFQDVEDIQKTIVGHRSNGAVIALSDVASVLSTYRERSGFTNWNGREIVALSILKEGSSNTVLSCREVHRILGQIQREFPGFKVGVISDQGFFIEQAINNVLMALFLGACCAFGVLFLFLRGGKIPAMVGVAIPIAITATFILLFLLDINFNVISLGGLALGTGLIVDNSIVVLENIQRHRESGTPLMAAAISGSREISLAVTASTLTTVSVFFPLIFVKGLAGELFFDLSMAVTCVLLISLLVSLTLLPMLISRLSDMEQTPSDHRSEAIIRGFLHGPVTRPIFFVFNLLFDAFQAVFNAFARWYEARLRWVIQHRVFVICIYGCLLGLSAYLYLGLEKELVPSVDQQGITIKLSLPQGTDLLATRHIASKVESLFLNHPGVKDVFSQVGIVHAVLSTQRDELSVETAKIEVRFKEGYSFDLFIQSVQEVAKNYPNCDIEIQEPQSSFVTLFQLSSDEVQMRFFGPDLKKCESIAQNIAATLTTWPSLDFIRVVPKLGNPEYHIYIDRDRTAHYGITSQQIIDFLSAYLRGVEASQIEAFGGKTPLEVTIKRDVQVQLSDLLNAEIPHSSGTMLPMREFIRVKEGVGYAEIRHEKGTRVVAILADVRGKDPVEISQKLQAYLNQLEIPEGYDVEIAGQNTFIAESLDNLIVIIALSIALVFMVIASHFESLRLPFVILTAVPLALAGVVFILLVTGQSLNIMSLIGIVVLVGIVVNDSIVKIDFIDKRYKEGATLLVAIQEAGQKRLRPIVMTTVTTILGLVPMALSKGVGAELWHPLAWTIIGGMGLSTFLILFAVPALYGIVVRKNR